MTDSLNGHAPRPVERVYCAGCSQLWPCPGYLAAPGILPKLEALLLASRQPHAHYVRSAHSMTNDDEPSP
jgi:hypothetical protein